MGWIISTMFLSLLPPHPPLAALRNELSGCCSHEWAARLTQELCSSPGHHSWFCAAVQGRSSRVVPRHSWSHPKPESLAAPPPQRQDCPTWLSLSKYWGLQWPYFTGRYTSKPEHSTQSWLCSALVTLQRNSRQTAFCVCVLVILSLKSFGRPPSAFKWPARDLTADLCLRKQLWDFFSSHITDRCKELAKAWLHSP